MKAYLVQTPKFVQRLFRKRIWAFPFSKDVFLTFDDGPIPEVTPWVLDLLKHYNAKATFFCIGDNVRKHPELFKRIIQEGHAVGNHTMHHLNGHKTPLQEYIDNVNACHSVLGTHSSELFRPPYGKLTSRQSKALRTLGYQIIMWDVLSADFDADVSEEKCFQNVSNHLQPGSIVVFHDSLKAEKNLKHALPMILETIKEKGWKCVPIVNNDIEQLK